MFQATKLQNIKAPESVTSAFCRETHGGEIEQSSALSNGFLLHLKPTLNAP